MSTQEEKDLLLENALKFDGLSEAEMQAEGL